MYWGEMAVINLMYVPTVYIDSVIYGVGAGMVVQQFPVVNPI